MGTDYWERDVRGKAIRELEFWGKGLTRLPIEKNPIPLGGTVGFEMLGKKLAFQGEVRKRGFGFNRPSP